MRWIRVKFKHLDDVKTPGFCPNCGQSPANTPTPLVWSFGVPFVVVTTWRGTWPVCADCAELFARYRFYRGLLGIGPAVLLIIAAIVAAVRYEDRGGFTIGGWLLWWALIVGVVGWIVPSVHQFCIRCKEGRISNYPPVQPIHGGGRFFSGRAFGAYEFKHAPYVLELLQLNEGNATCNMKRLEKALDAWGRRAESVATVPGAADHRGVNDQCPSPNDQGNVE